jgi:serine/threonine protein kinase
MEFLEGETLAGRLRKGSMPLNETLRIGIAIAEALAMAHMHGIGHRDLKPGNIMLTPAGAQLMDFGLAKSTSPTLNTAASNAPVLSAARTMSEASPMSPLTSAGTIIGTIQYMASYNNATYLQERHKLPPELLQNIAVAETFAAKAAE